MGLFDSMIITGIEPPMVVHSEKDKRVDITNRRWFGLSFCLSGQITYEMNGKFFVSNGQCAVLLPKGGTYTLTGNKEGLFPVINFYCENFACDEITLIPLKNPKTYIRDFEAIQKLHLRGAGQLEIFSIFYKILNNLSSEGRSGASILTPAIQHIENNISDPSLSNTALAKTLGISEVYLRKLFFKHYNTSPKQYILDFRIQKAKQMLVETPFTVLVISESCGFSTPNHFCRAFKQHTGMTPTQYACQNRAYEI